MDIESNEDREIAEKILKLLRKAESTDYENEAQAFEKKAEELMGRHSLSRGDVRKSEYVVRKGFDDRFTRCPGWYKDLHFTVTQFLGVYHVYHHTGPGNDLLWTWAGLPRDVKMARYIIDAIVGQISALTDQWKEERRRRRKRLEEKLDRALEEIDRLKRKVEETGVVDHEVIKRLQRIARESESLKEDIENLATGRKQTNSYRVGIVNRISQRLQKMVDDVSGGRAQKALVHQGEQETKREEAKDVALEIIDEPSEAPGPKYSDRQARKEGFEDGTQVEVHKAAPEGVEKDRRLSE